MRRGSLVMGSLSALVSAVASLFLTQNWVRRGKWLLIMSSKVYAERPVNRGKCQCLHCGVLLYIKPNV